MSNSIEMPARTTLIMIPSPADLTYFIAVAELQNLSRAAESLNISQPSLTLAMRRLEESLGTPLLIRHKRGVSLTKAGKQLQAYARHLLQQWEMVKTETLASMHEVQGSFTLGCHPSVALYSLARFLPRLMTDHPKLNIKLKHDLSRHITDDIINLNVDIGIVVNPARHADLVIKKIANDKITLWQSKHHAKPITPDTILICDPDLVQTQVLLKKLKKQGLEFNRILQTSSLEVIADLTEAGTGIGILPGNIARLHQVTAIAKAPFYDDEICLIYHGQNREVKALQVIANAIKKAFS